MLSYLLGLLKIIGILFLVLLILAAAVLCIVLFVPIRYKGSGTIDDKEKKVSLKASFLLHSIRFSLEYEYPAAPVISFRILWIDGLKSAQQTFSKDNKDKKTDTKNKDTNRKKSSPDTGNATEHKISYYMDILQRENTKQFLSHLVNRLLRILKSIRPKVLKINGEFGFDTPDTTGKIYGFYCMLMPFLGKHVHLVPNFEEAILDGNFYCKGRITIFVILLNVCRILMDKRLRPLLKSLKNGGNQNG